MPPASEPSAGANAKLGRARRKRSEALASIAAHERSIAKLLARIEALDAEIAFLSSDAEENECIDLASEE